VYKGFAGFLLLLGLGCLGVSVWLPAYIDSALDAGLTSSVIITADSAANGDESYRTFVSPTDPDSVPVYWRVYVWNVTNPEAVVYNGSKPELVEVGPYVYQDMQVKFNVTFQTDIDGANTMRYKIAEYFLFQPQLSGPGLDPDRDSVWTVNMAFQSLIPQGYRANISLPHIFNFLVSRQ
jgi:hypothetical protein